MDRITRNTVCTRPFRAQGPWLDVERIGTKTVVHEYTRLLIEDFRSSGGRIEPAEFRSPADFGRLKEQTLVNATGYGARALFRHESLTPVRGQVARAIPDADVRYGLFYRNVVFVPRRDGLVFQAAGENDYYGYGDETEVPDRAEAERAVNTIGSLFGPA